MAHHSHFLIYPHGRGWRWTLYLRQVGGLPNAQDFDDKAACEASVRLVQRSLRCTAVCYGAADDDF